MTTTETFKITPELFNYLNSYFKPRSKMVNTKEARAALQDELFENYEGNGTSYIQVCSFESKSGESEEIYIDIVKNERIMM